jgi:transcriptional regulator with XRE-family HTH domain
MQELSKKLRALREVHGYKQEFVGNHLRISQTGYSKIEVGEVDLSIRHLEKLAELYKITPEQLLNWNGKISINTILNNENVVATNSSTNNVVPIQDSMKKTE